MCRPAYWNHNTAYYDWIKARTSECGDILDVGCGDGGLVRCLDDGMRRIVGIDADKKSIECARSASSSVNVQFINDRFETYDFRKKFDAVIFVASIHHMEMDAALDRAKSLLKSDGMILIVGLAKPSNLLDWMVEIGRVIPCAVMSKARNMQPSEAVSIPVSYYFPEMNEIRKTASMLLPSARIRYGLYYRYLLYWEKSNSVPVCR